MKNKYNHLVLEKHMFSLLGSRKGLASIFMWGKGALQIMECERAVSLMESRPPWLSLPGFYVSTCLACLDPKQPRGEGFSGNDSAVVHKQYVKYWAGLRWTTCFLLHTMGHMVEACTQNENAAAAFIPPLLHKHTYAVSHENILPWLEEFWQSALNSGLCMHKIG